MHVARSSSQLGSTRRLVTFGLIAALVMALAALAPPAHAATATVRGVLQGKTADGTIVGIKDAAIELRDVTTGSSARTAWTREDGSFELDVDDSGSWGSINDEFSLLFNYCPWDEPSCSDYPTQWLGGAYTMEDATPFTLSSGATVTKNHTITIGATVTGSVILADGTPATEGSVSVSVATAHGRTASIYPSPTIGSDGVFSISGVPTGADISLNFYRSWDDADPRCYVTPTLELGSLTPGQVVTADNLVEQYRGSLIAQVVDPQGQPVDYMGAVPLTNRGSGQFESPQMGPFGTDEDGRYKQCVDDGTQMKLRFADNLGADMGVTVSRTVPMATIWVGTDGARGTTEANAPIINISGTDVIDLGTVIVTPQTDSDPGVTITAGSVKITGTARVGNKLTVKSAGWSPASTSLSYQWMRGSQPIPGATKASYVLTPADAKKQISVKVTGTATNATAVVRSSSVVKVKLGVLTAKKLTLKGKLKVGKNIRVKTAGWSKGANLTYRWSRAVKGKWKTVKNGTKAAYVIKKADRGAKLRVVVTAKKSGYQTVSKKRTTKKIR